MSDTGLPPEEVQYQQQHEFENYIRNLGGFYLVLIVLTFVVTALRILSRRVTRQQFKADDWTFLAGASLAQGSFIVLLIYAFGAGLGEHWVELTGDQRILFSKLNYAFNILNVANYPLIKISILLLYRRIFVGKRFHQAVWACIFFVGGVGISLTLVAIFACTPVRAFYDLSVSGTCIDSVKFYMASAIFNMIHDIILLILPMPVVWRLQTTLKRKIAISALFVTGGLTFIVSILRLVYYLQYSNLDPSYSFTATAFATPAEVALALLVASAIIWLPAWRVVRKYARETFDSLRSRAGGRHNDDNATTLQGQPEIGEDNSDKHLNEKAPRRALAELHIPEKAHLGSMGKKERRNPHKSKAASRLPKWVRTSRITPLYLDRDQTKDLGFPTTTAADDDDTRDPNTPSSRRLSQLSTISAKPFGSGSGSGSGSSTDGDSPERSGSGPTLVEQQSHSPPKHPSPSPSRSPSPLPSRKRTFPSSRTCRVKKEAVMNSAFSDSQHEREGGDVTSSRATDASVVQRAVEAAARGKGGANEGVAGLPGFDAVPADGSRGSSGDPKGEERGEDGGGGGFWSGLFGGITVERQFEVQSERCGSPR